MEHGTTHSVDGMSPLGMSVPTLGAIVTLIGICIVVWVAYFVFRHSGDPVSSHAVKTKLYRIRIYVFIVLVIAILSTLSYVWPKTPYMDVPGMSYREPDKIVNVVGRKWDWSVDGVVFTTDDPLVLEEGLIEFDLTSPDVNHGFGLYDSNGLFAQSQVMPGKINKLMVHLSPGRYHLYCLEYCDVAHHEMVADIMVIPKK